jgi:hypothetical protein
MDIGSVAGDLSVLKTAFETVKTALELVRDVQGVLPKGEKKDAVEKTLAIADMQVRQAEAEIAKAFGYKLCQCRAPVPTPMPLVGHVIVMGRRTDVHECPLCHSVDTQANQWPSLEGQLVTRPEVHRLPPKARDPSTSHGWMA